MTAYPNLKHLCSAYLHQDFDLDFGSADLAIRAFSIHVGDAEREALVQELEEIAAAGYSEEALRELIANELGASYHYAADWPQADLWLEHVKDLLNKTL